MPQLSPVDLIVAKRDGRTLDDAAIRELVSSYAAGDVPDYQMSAFLMAAFLRGMEEAETTALTEAMLDSGITVDLSDIPGTKVDKHSTGGVGDKISLILAPIVAACGVPVPMISGRGLGFTGGTLDKLESISGFRTNLSIEDYKKQLAEIGIVMIGQTDDIAPADRSLYALRDVTGTVEFIPFIASSIMSKKLAEGIDVLVLDVKCGRGAFMKNEYDARRLAEALVEIGQRFGKRTVAWLTNMDAPLGRAAGNWPEVVESVGCLRGDDVPDVMELTHTLAGEMIHLGGMAASPEAGREMAVEVVRSGRAMDKFLELVNAQGGDERLLDDPHLREGFTPAVEVPYEGTGAQFVHNIDALAIGRAVTKMGAGRQRKEDDVDPLAGIVLAAVAGERVEPGQPLAHIYTQRSDRLSDFAAEVAGAFSFTRQRPEHPAILLDRFTEGMWASHR